ncbi:MAG: sensor histidine kinase [Chloroflexi bacterium]|nr:sensor histidine kinase [Chloroflexota bacterium]
MLSVFDTRMLRQVIGNLVQNALKYSPESHPVWVTLVHDGEQITLRVQDEGICIPPEDMKRLFEPFHRAANVGAISGTGLGLSIAKQAVELHGGTIAVESALDRGSTFTVRLPKVE